MPTHFHSPNPTWQRLKEPARTMRHAPTQGEAALWRVVRDRRLGGHKFRRQYAIGCFIVDFVCLERRLILEVDGSIHQQQIIADATRQGSLEQQGFLVMRFTNAEVMTCSDAVKQRILEALESQG